MSTLSNSYSRRNGQGSTAADGWLNYYNDSAGYIGDGYISGNIYVSVSSIKSASGAFTGNVPIRVYLSDDTEIEIGWLKYVSFNANSGSYGSVSGWLSDMSISTANRIKLVQKQIVRVDVGQSDYNDGKDIKCGESSNVSLQIEYDEYYTAPSAPSSVSLDSTYVPSGGSTVLRWSGASAGTFNPIAGYLVYRGTTQIADLGASVSSLAIGSGSIPSVGSSYTYKVITKGTKSNSGYSSGVTLYTYGAVSAPTAVAVSQQMVSPGTTVTLSWSGASGGSYNAISNYRIYRSTSASSGYELLQTVGSGVTSYGVTSPSSPGTKFYYKIETVGAHSTSGLSSSYAAVGSNAAPGNPSVSTPPGAVTHNSRPRFLVTVGTDSEDEVQTMTYTPAVTVSRTSNIHGNDKIVARISSKVSSGSNSLGITQTDPYAATSGLTLPYTYAPVEWTDATVEAGTTLIRAAHLNEIRSVLDDLCTWYGISPTEWAEEIVAGETPTAHWESHIAEIHAAVRRIVNYVNAWDETAETAQITLPALITSTAPAAAVISQLRQIVTAL